MAAYETCGLGARPELWMEAGRALPSPGVQRDPAEPKDRSACRWVCACWGAPKSCDRTPRPRPAETGRRACSAPDFGHTVPRMGETDRQRRAREASHRYFTEALARMFDPDRKNRTAGRIIDLWDARRARGAEPLFHPTIGGAIRAGRPWLTCYCPGCGVVGEIDLRKIVIPARAGGWSRDRRGLLRPLPRRTPASRRWS